MFYYLSGILALVDANLAVIDCGGVGYACHTTNYTLAKLQLGKPAKLFTYCGIKEDAFDIYGFSTREELNCFRQLISVSGVGPKAALLGIEIDPQGALEIASRSRGTPRIANRMLRRVRDFADIYHDSVITREAADHALAQLEVDKLGLDAIDRRMLTAIIRNYGGGPVGLETLAATIGEEAVTLEDVYEPYLMQIGFLSRTPRGRCVTQLAYDHLHLENPNAPQEQQLSF